MVVALTTTSVISAYHH